MENKNEKFKNIVIVLLLVIVILLAVLLTKIVNKKYKNNETTNSIVELTEVEAKEILKYKFEVANNYMDSPNTYCGNRPTISNKTHESGNKYYISNEFNSYNELKNYLLEYMTEDILNQKKFFSSNELEYYIEENNYLYCLNLGKSSIYLFNRDKTTYEITSIKENEINANVVAYYDIIYEGSETRTIQITLSKNNDTWQISSYERQ